MEKVVVFLGGTCNGSTWRDELIPMLEVSFFNPVVPEWNEEAYEREKWHREFDDVCLYVLTPKMTGSYAVAEVVDDSNKRPDKTVLCILRDDKDKHFDDVQWKSLRKVIAMCEENGATIIEDLKGVAEYLNKFNR